MSKLSFYATIKYDDLRNENVISSVETYEKAQDLIEFHNVVINYIKDTIVGEDTMQGDDVDTILASVMSHCYESVANLPILNNLLKTSVNDLLRERKISVISILDVVTLMSIPSDELFADILKLLHNKIESEEFFYHIVWRRAWLSNEYVLNLFNI